MSIAISQTRLIDSPTWRQFQSACLCVILTIGVGCVLYGIETGILHCEHRFVENPADTMTRAIGIAHFSIGWLFLFSSPRLRNRSAISRLTFWTLFGLAFCWVFATNGGDKNPWLLLAFYSFFFIHEVCDEAYLFQNSGELHEDPARADRFLSATRWTVSLGLIAMLAGLQIVRGHFLERSAVLHDLPTGWLIGIWLAIALPAIAATMHTIRLARSLYGTLSECAAVYRPLFAVYFGIGSILLIGSLFGSVGANLVILVHGLTWLVYTHRRLSERPGKVTGLWTWVRNSPTGFLTLHVFTTALALLLFALRTHVWERTGIVCDLVSKTWFPYWSIMHIAMAFWRGK